MENETQRFRSQHDRGELLENTAANGFRRGQDEQNLLWTCEWHVGTHRSITHIFQYRFLF